MSWEDYITTMEQGGSGSVKGAKCKYVAILGKDGSLWGESASKKFGTQEMMTLVGAAKPNDDSLFTNGPTLGGIKFTCVRNDEGTLIMKGKDDKDNVLVITPTGKAAIVAFHDGEGGVKAADVLTSVSPTKTFLTESGY